MDFTIIICTYNRSHNLPGCVECLAQQQDAETFDWEILIVDNNSSDDTRQVVEQLASVSSVKLRYAFEPQQGLNYARNQGVQASDSRYFCFVDDDIKVRPDWLAALYQALESNDADTVGGRIHLDPDIQLVLKTIGLLNLVSTTGSLRASKRTVALAMCNQPDGQIELEYWEKKIAELLTI